MSYDQCQGTEPTTLSASVVVQRTPQLPANQCINFVGSHSSTPGSVMLKGAAGTIYTLTFSSTDGVNTQTQQCQVIVEGSAPGGQSTTCSAS